MSIPTTKKKVRVTFFPFSFRPSYVAPPRRLTACDFYPSDHRGVACDQPAPYDFIGRPSHAIVSSDERKATETTAGFLLRSLRAPHRSAAASTPPSSPRPDRRLAALG